MVVSRLETRRTCTYVPFRWCAGAACRFLAEWRSRSRSWSAPLCKRPSIVRASRDTRRSAGSWSATTRTSDAFIPSDQVAHDICAPVPHRARPDRRPVASIRSGRSIDTSALLKCVKCGQLLTDTAGNRRWVHISSPCAIITECLCVSRTDWRFEARLRPSTRKILGWTASD